ncbi:MAG TPA: molybdopterin-dependent oxidoreductase [Solirubrobacteraceae bacterium]
MLEERLAPLQRGPLRPGAFSSRLHDERVAMVLGIALGVTFTTCFLTGLISHFAQHPLDLGFLSMPASPASLYRVTQGVHVASGIASIPLLAAKLWTVYPRLFAFPPIENLVHAFERALIPFLTGGAIFMLFTGLLNTARWYPWGFNFTVAHYWTAWIVIGALIVHIGAKLAIVGPALRRAPVKRAPEGQGDGLSRRGLLAAAGTAVAAVTLTTVGQTFRPLKDVARLAPRRPDVGPQGIPVNKSAIGAGVVDAAHDAGWKLEVGGRVARPLSLSLAQLAHLPQHEAHLPIACVEGWSAAARWRGVAVGTLLEIAGAEPGSEVVVHSLQQGGSYSSSRLNVAHARHPDTLLALQINGETLHIDHGYPARLIAPNRPGVQQTKWVARLEVV